MLLLHEVHTVAGRNEDEFEAAFRNGWMPTLGADDDARLLYFLKPRARNRPGVSPGHDHRARATAPRTSVWQRACSAAICAAGRPTSTCCGTRSRASCCCPSTGRRCRTSISRPSRPTAASTTRCSTWKTARGRTRRARPLPRQGAHALRAEPGKRTERSLLTLLGVFQAALAAPRRREVVLWQRVDFPDRLPGLFTRELPAHVKGPGTWMNDAFEVRDDWESRLLRSTSWSPLG